MPITKILIANRGEIAVRIARTCKLMGISSVAVYSDEDAHSLHVASCDEAIRIGPASVKESYLNQDALIQATKLSKAQAIHPGYGFLSENAEFAKRCEQENIIFIGPTPHSISVMGSKIEAKRLLKGNNQIPLIPGYNGANQNVEHLKQQAISIGFPVLLKASAGGGGKGMRVVRRESELLDGIQSAKTEAKNSFGDDKLLIEKYFENVKHVEIQIIGDSHGNVHHLFERECSVQRRHQKVVEEAPCSILSDTERKQMSAAAVAIGKTIDYLGVGTVEFILDCSTRKFYFLEVNTRLQVEHPVTEEVTGLDLVFLQIEVANGKSLKELKVLEARLSGHAIECRLYAEDPTNQFFPSTGQILKWKPLQNEPGIRYDTGIVSGSTISVFYDPMIAKITAFGETREIANQKLIRALKNTVVIGDLKTNKDFLLTILTHQKWIDGTFNTHFINDYLTTNGNAKIAASTSDVANNNNLAIVALLHDWKAINDKRRLLSMLPSGFRNNPYRMQFKKYKINNTVITVEYKAVPNKHRQPQTSFNFIIKIGNDEFNAQLQHNILTNSNTDADTLVITINNYKTKYVIQNASEDSLYIHNNEIGTTFVNRISKYYVEGQDDDSCANENPYVSQMPARILDVLVENGAKVKKGDNIIVMESMKMESKIAAVSDGVVELFVSKDQLVDAGSQLFDVVSNSADAKSN